MNNPLSKPLMLAAFVAAALGLLATFTAAAIAMDASLLEMSDQLDRVDSQDFQAAIERATSCTQARNFPCAESELSKAEKSANTGKDKKTLLASRQSLANEKQELANEKRRAEEARRRVEEERLRVAEVAQAERRRQQKAEESRSSGFQWGKALVMLGTGAVVGGNMSSEAQGKFIEGVLKDSMPGQDGVSNTTANANAYAAEQKARQDIADQQFRDRQAKKMADEAANNERLLKAARETRQPSGVQQGAAAEVGGQRDSANFQGTVTAPRSNVGQSVAQDNSWRTCGPNKKCLIGDGYNSFCSGPADPSKPMCKSECQMDGLSFYHDTTLPANAAYIPGDYKCPARTCNVINSCG